MNNTYISLTEFMTIVHKSETTIRRFIKEVLINCNTLIIKVKNKYYLDKILLEYFKYPYSYRISVSYFIHSVIKKPARSPVTFSEYQFEPYYETMYNDLSNIDWNIFGSVTYSREIPIVDCIYLFERLFRRIVRKFRCHVSLFYTTEKDKLRKGYHNHFVFHATDCDALSEIKNFIDGYFRRNNLGLTDLRIYDWGKNGLRYIMKEIPQINDGFELLRN